MCFLVCLEVHGIKLEVVVGIIVEYTYSTLYDLTLKAWHLEFGFSALTSARLASVIVLVSSPVV